MKEPFPSFNHIYFVVPLTTYKYGVPTCGGGDSIFYFFFLKKKEKRKAKKKKKEKEIFTLLVFIIKFY